MRLPIVCIASLILFTAACKKSEVFQKNQAADIEGELDIKLRSGRAVDREGESANSLCEGVLRINVYDNNFREYPAAPAKCFNFNLDLAKLMLQDEATPEDGVKDVSGLFQGIYYNAVLPQNHDPAKMQQGTVFGFTDAQNNPEYVPMGLPALITQPDLLASYVGRTFSKTVFARTNVGINSPGTWSFKVRSMGESYTTPSGLRFDNLIKAVRVLDGFDEIPSYMKSMPPKINQTYRETWQNLDPYAPVYERYRMDITDLIDGALIGTIAQGLLNDIDVELQLKSWRSL